MAIEQTVVLERALQAAAERGVSDVFLVPHEPVCLRIAGKVERLEGEVLTPEDVREIAVRAVGQEKVGSLAQTGWAVTSCGIEGVVSGWMCIGSNRGDTTITVRLLLARIPEMKSIGVPPVVREAAGRRGLLLFTGPPGCGKTTTMLSVLDNINATEARHICTVEDPIAAMLSSKQSIVQQREVGLDVPDALAGIGAAMRQGADVLCIGELRSLEEVRACVTAAQLDHLVLTQLHTATPQSSIRRLIEIQPPDQAAIFRRDLSQCLRCVASQALLDRADGKGRVAAYGVLVVDDEMRRAIAEGRDVLDRVRPLAAGCQSLGDEIQRLRREGMVSEDVFASAMERVRGEG